MKLRTHFLLLLAIASWLQPCISQSSSDAVLLRLEDDTRQVKVEALDPGTGHWLAIASGYRDNLDPGWMKIGLPDVYLSSQLRVLVNPQPSPFAGKWQRAAGASASYLAYPPSRSPVWLNEDSTTDGGAGDPVIEEADIWAWQENTLFFYNQYRGLQVIDMSDTLSPEWLDYYRYPAKGEDLYSIGNGQVVLIGTGSYWQGEKLALQFLEFDGIELSRMDTVELESGYYMDSRRYGDFLYVMTREWVPQVNPDGNIRNTPLIRLYTVSLVAGNGQERVINVQSFKGQGWLDAVLTAQPDGILLSLNNWDRWSPTGTRRWSSDVHVLVPGTDGILQEVGVAPLMGVLRDKYKLKFENGILTTVSQQADWFSGQFSRSTMLENFRLVEDRFEKIGQLALAPGETLFASRFYGDAVYIVTFLRVDPLFSINNSDPTQPFIAGELEVPGWSNYIEWVDEFLFAVGIEDNKVTVSTFDVADPSNMQLVDRVFLNEDSWVWSEAQYDDQAISFYPSSRILMLPFTTWYWSSSEMIQAMQLISWDESGALTLRGQIYHIDVPRRGVLVDDTVITVSGRELLTSNISDPDAPIEGGSTTLAWNVQYLIPFENYLLQLESPESAYSYWRVPMVAGSSADPVLYVTSMTSPNITEAEIPLAEGRLLGVAHRENQLILLQDKGDILANAYWEIPETQDLAIRTYDLTNPLEPVLQSEIFFTTEFLGSAFDAELLSGNHLLWKTKSAPMFGILYTDMIWPGPWYGQNTLSYLVTEVGLEGAVSIVDYESMPMQDYWYGSAGWFWRDPLLFAGFTTYEQVELPDLRTEYKALSVLKAIDLSDPAFPLKLPDSPLPTHLADVAPVGIGMNHFLYFDMDYRTVEVWGWDGAAVFKLFEQALYPEDNQHYAYSYDWLAPFHLRGANEFVDEQWSYALDVWYHHPDKNRFQRLERHPMNDSWFRDHSLKDDQYLLATNDQIRLFSVDPLAGTFSSGQSLDIPFPNLYSMNLEASVLSDDFLYLPFGIYGIDVLPVTAPVPQDIQAVYQQLEVIQPWRELSALDWQRVGKSDPDQAGAMVHLQWIHWPDAIAQIDSEATDLGDLWRESAWFGQYASIISHSGRIRHMEHGLLDVFAFDQLPEGGFFLHDPQLGFLWTHRDVYPYIYAYNSGEWIYYVSGSGLGPYRWFYGMDSGWVWLHSI